MAHTPPASRAHVQQAMAYCKANGADIKAAVRDGNDQAVELWGAYVGARQASRQGRSGSCDIWLVRCHQRFVGQGGQ